MDEAYVIPIFVLKLRKTPEKLEPGIFSRPGIEPGPPRREATMLPLECSGGLCMMQITFVSLHKLFLCEELVLELR